MIRMFNLALGLGVGFAAGVATMRRVDEAKRAMRPTAVAERLGRRAGESVRRLREAFEVGRSAATTREAELRSAHQVPGLAAPLER